MRTFLLLLVVALAPILAQETPAEVSQVVDGDTIAVRLNGQETRVRLLWIDTPESRSNRHGEAKPEGVEAAKALRTLLPKGSVVRLWSPGESLEQDVYRRILAVVLLGSSGLDSAQEYQIRAGWSPIWKKYGAPPAPFADRFAAAEKSARESKAGGWGSIPQWMVDKSNETTARRRDP